MEIPLLITAVARPCAPAAIAGWADPAMPKASASAGKIADEGRMIMPATQAISGISRLSRAYRDFRSCGFYGVWPFTNIYLDGRT